MSEVKKKKKKKKKKKPDMFNERAWLNPENSGSTGSIVCYDGPAHWADEEGGRENMCFLEVADCHCKARLHLARFDSYDQYLEKIKKMREVINRYIVHLEKYAEERRNEK